MVFDNAVMHQSQSLTGNMGVRISRRRLSMGRPTSVGNARATQVRLQLLGALQLCDFSQLLVHQQISLDYPTVPIPAES